MYSDAWCGEWTEAGSILQERPAPTYEEYTRGIGSLCAMVDEARRARAARGETDEEDGS